MEQWNRQQTTLNRWRKGRPQMPSVITPLTLPGSRGSSEQENLL